MRVPAISIAASARSAFSRAVVSAFSNPAMYWPSSSRARGSVGSMIRSGAGATSASRARARCSVLLTAAVVDAEHARDVGRGEAEHLPEQEHSPLPGGQVLQAGDDRQPQPLARGDDRAGVFRLGGHQGVRDRFQPRDARFGRAGRGVRILGRAAQSGGQRPPAALFERGQAGVGGDAVEPGAHRDRPSNAPYDRQARR